MGLGASNLSSAFLSSYQEALNEVSQNISNTAANVGSQQVNLEQEINFTNGDSKENPCTAIKIAYDKCLPKLVGKCTKEQKYSSYFKDNDLERNANACDAEFGNTQISDSLVCPLTATGTFEQRESAYQQCRNQYLRKKCENMQQFDTITDCNNSLSDTIYELRGSLGTINYSKTTNGLPNCYEVSDGSSCYYEIQPNNYYYCRQNPNTGSGYDLCLQQCGTLCTAEEEKILTPPQPQIYGSICAVNNANVSMVSKQVSSANTDARMTSQVTNVFQNDITKTITQTNKGLNFGQFNNSDERTSMTQKVATAVKQAIKASAQNTTTQTDSQKQTINFVNKGLIDTGTDCTAGKTKDGTPIVCVRGDSSLCPGGGNGIILTNQSLNNLSVDQTSTSILTAVLDSGILNDLKNTYKYTLTQTNEGIDPLAILIALLVGIIIILSIISFGLSKAIESIGKALENPWVLAFLIFAILALSCIPLIIYFTVYTPSSTNTPVVSSDIVGTSKCNLKYNTKFLNISVYGITDSVCKEYDQIFDLSNVTPMSATEEKRIIQDRLNQKYPGVFPLLFTYCDNENVIKKSDSRGVTLIFSPIS